MDFCYRGANPERKRGETKQPNKTIPKNTLSPNWFAVNTELFNVVAATTVSVVNLDGCPFKPLEQNKPLCERSAV